MSHLGVCWNERRLAAMPASVAAVNTVTQAKREYNLTRDRALEFRFFVLKKEKNCFEIVDRLFVVLFVCSWPTTSSYICTIIFVEIEIVNFLKKKKKKKT